MKLNKSKKQSSFFVSWFHYFILVSKCIAAYQKQYFVLRLLATPLREFQYILLKTKRPTCCDIFLKMRYFNYFEIRELGKLVPRVKQRSPWKRGCELVSYCARKEWRNYLSLWRNTHKQWIILKLNI